MDKLLRKNTERILFHTFLLYSINSIRKSFVFTKVINKFINHMKEVNMFEIFE